MRQHHPPLVASQHGVPGRGVLGVRVQPRPRVPVTQDDPLEVSEEAGPELEISISRLGRAPKYLRSRWFVSFILALLRPKTYRILFFAQRWFFMG